MADVGRLFAGDLQVSGERRALLRALLERRGMAAGSEPEIPRRTGSGSVPLSFAQERMYFLHQLDPASPAYHVPLAIGLHGVVDVPVLRRSLDELVRRHEALRTTIEVDPATGDPVQRVHPAGPVRLEYVDVSGAPEGTAERLRDEQTSVPFDLATGPLLRILLLRHSADRYTLLLTLHHIVVDAWSMSVLVTELARLYDGRRRGTGSPPEPARQYADYAVWQRDWLRGERLDGQLDYWRDRLAGLPTLALPTDHPRPAVLGSAGGQRDFRYPAELLSALNRLAREEKATLFMVLLAGFVTVLARYSGQLDIPVGTPVAGRRRPELENVIGFFVNTLVLRTDLAGRPSFREVVRRVRQTALGAFEHQDLPFERLVDELAPQRGLDRTPLFQVMFGLQTAPVGRIDLADLEVTTEPVDTRSAMFDLMLIADEHPDGLAGLVSYRTDLFTAGTVDRLVDHLRTVLTAGTADPGVSVGAIDLLGPVERRAVLAHATGPGVPVPAVTLHELVTAQARRTPDAVAVSAEGGELRYLDLERRANRLARRLRAHGVGPDTPVGIAMERSVELVVALLGALKAGGCCVPLDLSYPADRLRWLSTDAGVGALLVDAPGREWLAPAGVPVVTVSRGPDDAVDDTPPPVVVRPDNLGYVIYTSGSTGHPKGVMVPHGALVNHMRWMRAAYPLGPDDRVLQKTPIGFDASIWEFWLPLIAGARLVLARPGGERDNGYLVSVLREQEITTLQAVPGLLDVLVDTPGFGGCRRLRRVFCGGEALTTALADRFRAVSDADLVNLYGPAETCIDAVTHRVAPGGHGMGVPIGRPITNLRAYVLDGEMRLVPDGIRGELYLGGAGLGRGYLRRPDLTAERFVPDPFADRPGGRLYRTGDVAVRRPDGVLEFVGRADRQVKVRGHRIEPAEVEHVLAGHPAVRQLVVRPVPGPTDIRLVAYATLRPGTTLTVADLREYAAGTLPGAMRPEDLVVLAELPRTASGKLDPAALPAPDRVPQPPARAPRGPLERLLCEQFAAVLGQPRVDPERSFFAAGGNSLQAMRLVARLRSGLGREIGVSLLFQAPSPAELADRLAADRTGDPGGNTRIPRLPVADGAPMPVSHAQHRLWFVQRLAPGRADYNVGMVARLTGDLDVPAMRRAVTALTTRHEVLRTRFPESGGIVHAVTDPPGQVSLPLDRPADPAAAALDLIRRPFDLTDGPVWRAALLHAGDREHWLVVALHHIVTDGWSTGLLVRDLRELYAAQRQGRPARLPVLPVRYADYAAWQRTSVTGEVAARHLGYWRGQLSGARPVRLGRPAGGAVGAERAGAAVPLSVPPALRERLAALAREAGGTVFTALLAGFAVLLHRETGRGDLIIGTDLANRPVAAVENVVGPFLNQVALRIDVRDLPTFRQLVVRARHVCAAAQAHGDVPFEDVVAATGAPRDGTGDPLIGVKIIYEEAVPGATLDDLVMDPVDLPTYAVKHDVDLFLRDEGRQLTGALHYALDTLDAATATTLARRYLAMLDRCAASPDSRIDALTPVPETGADMADHETRPAAPAFHRTRPIPVRAAAGRLVTAEPLDGSGLPLCVRPAAEEMDLAGWAAANADWIGARLVESGALLFRGFGVTDVPAFEAVARELCAELYRENGEHTPVATGSEVQVPVFYPPEAELLWHNENSFNDRWPTRIMFCCATRPATGGESTLVDSRAVYRRLDPVLRHRFARHGVRYQRNFRPGLGLDWRQVYGTDDPAAVERACRSTGVRCDWGPDGRLRTRAVRPAVVRHPVTGEWVWFNQAQHWHPACLDPRTRASLSAMFDEPDLPRACHYGDGGPIEDAELAEILGVYRELEVAVQWQEGDLLLLDNVLVAHGRRPYAGTRRVLVAMGDEAGYEAADYPDSTRWPAADSSRSAASESRTSR